MDTKITPIVVSGASTGIGRSIVEALSRKGHSVYAGARKDSDIQALNELPNVTAVKLDVTSESDINRLTQRIHRAGNGLSGLVNNAGIADMWPLTESTEDDLVRIFGVNLFGLHNLTRAVLPLLRQAQGRIVNISSVAGIANPNNLGVYNMSKHALEAYSDRFAEEVQEASIRVSLVEPGNFESNAWKSIKPLYVERLTRDPDLADKDFFRTLQESLSQTIENWQHIGNPEVGAPSKVADNVLDALFTEHPKPRYLVTPSDDQFYWVVNALLSKVVQLNNGSEYGVTRQELHSLLDEALDSGQEW